MLLALSRTVSRDVGFGCFEIVIAARTDSNRIKSTSFCPWLLGLALHSTGLSVGLICSVSLPIGESVLGWEAVFRDCDPDCVASSGKRRCGWSGLWSRRFDVTLSQAASRFG